MVHFQLGSLSALLASEPIPDQDLSLDRAPVARPALVPGRHVLPGPPGLVLSAPTVPDGREGAAGLETHTLSPGHGHLQRCAGWWGLVPRATGQVFGPGWLLIWQPGPTTFLDLESTNLETVSGAFSEAPQLLNREINKKGT